MGESDPGGEANMGGRRPWGGSGYFGVPIATTAAAAAARHRSRCQRLCVQRLQRHEAGASFTKKEKGNGRQTEKL